MAIPAGLMEKALRGMEALYRRGVRYPISFAGAEGDVAPLFPPTYKDMDELLLKLKGDDNRLIVGITGGIASGKSTVSDMLEELGAPLIDFDQLARQVVEPGTPALASITDYFGRQVLGEDGRLDRKKLSDIVFKDFEKRKKLESFTHPAIYEAFFQQVNEITANTPDAIIQASIPLLVELNLQFLFDKLILVYISPEKQVERLALRDKISKADAANILKSQLSIDEKLAYADFVINNEKSVEETKKQVNKVWRELKKIQK